MVSPKFELWVAVGFAGFKLFQLFFGFLDSLFDFIAQALVNAQRFGQRSLHAKQSLFLLAHGLQPRGVLLPDLFHRHFAVDGGGVHRLRDQRFARHQLRQPDFFDFQSGNAFADRTQFGFVTINPLFDARLSLPSRERVYHDMEALINSFKLVYEGVRPPPGTCYDATEAANGELGFLIVSDGGTNPYKIKVRSPCLTQWAAFADMAEGHLVSDMFSTLGSINIIAGELDR